MRVLLDVKVGQKCGHTDFVVAGELFEGVVNGGKSLLGEVVADVVDKLLVVDSLGVGELLLEGADFLGGEEDSALVEEEIEVMLGHASAAGGVVGGDVGVEVDEVLVVAPEQLELDLVADLDNRVHPVH